ncbi:MAG TPA: electron transport complex subunit RsxG [Pseudomonadales bacterium]|nr:electron transport complex subunit RsxG [Pseudomonadales bacterium]
MLPITAIGRNGLLLAVFGLVTTAGIALTFEGTKANIAEQERLAQARALLDIMPAESHSNDMLESAFALPAFAELGLRHADIGYRALDADNQVLAVLLPALARDGYSGDIRLLVGITAQGTVAGVRTLSHNETPGLGDKIDLKKSTWILGFDGTSLTTPNTEQWLVKKDGGVFDSFTGATITPRAVTGAVKRALVYFDNHRDTLLATTPESP